MINVAKYGNDNGEVLARTKRHVLYVILAVHEHISKHFVCQNVILGQTNVQCVIPYYDMTNF